MSATPQSFEGSRAFGRHVTSMTIYDVDHYDDDARAKIINSYPAHEREARAKGIPTMGSGRVFPIADEEILIAPRAIPAHWPQINGLDFGWDHPFACVNLAWDRDADCVYVVRTFRKRESTPILHAASIRPWGEWIPCAWPHDGYQHDKGSGLPLAQQYRDQKLNMLPENATHIEGGNGVEAGLMDMLDRMQTSRFKVLEGNGEWMEEFRLYHRLEGKIVKIRDDLISATRYAIMMLRHATVKPSAATGRRARIGTIA